MAIINKTYKWTLIQSTLRGKNNDKNYLKKRIYTLKNYKKKRQLCILKLNIKMYDIVDVKHVYYV